MTRPMASISVIFTSSMDSRIGCERSNRTPSSIPGRHLLLQSRKHGPDAIHNLYGVRAGLPLNGKQDRSLAVKPACRFRVLNAIGNPRDLVEA